MPLIFIVFVVVVDLELFEEEEEFVGTESGPVKFEPEFELVRIVVVLLDVEEEELEELFEEVDVEDDDDLVEVVGKLNGPKVPAPPAVLIVPTLLGDEIAAVEIDGVESAEATTIATKEKICTGFLLRLIDLRLLLVRTQDPFVDGGCCWLLPPSTGANVPAERVTTQFL